MTLPAATLDTPTQCPQTHILVHQPDVSSPSQEIQTPTLPRPSLPPRSPRPIPLQTTRFSSTPSHGPTRSSHRVPDGLRPHLRRGQRYGCYILVRITRPQPSPIPVDNGPDCLGGSLPSRLQCKLNFKFHLCLHPVHLLYITNPFMHSFHHANLVECKHSCIPASRHVYYTCVCVYV